MSPTIGVSKSTSANIAFARIMLSGLEGLQADMKDDDHRLIDTVEVGSGCERLPQEAPTTAEINRNERTNADNEAASEPGIAGIVLKLEVKLTMRLPDAVGDSSAQGPCRIAIRPSWTPHHVAFGFPR